MLLIPEFYNGTFSKPKDRRMTSLPWNSLSRGTLKLRILTVNPPSHKCIFRQKHCIACDGGLGGQTDSGFNTGLFPPGKTELAKQTAKYLHKDVKKVSGAAALRFVLQGGGNGVGLDSPLALLHGYSSGKDLCCAQMSPSVLPVCSSGENQSGFNNIMCSQSEAVDTSTSSIGNLFFYLFY